MLNFEPDAGGDPEWTLVSAVIVFLTVLAFAGTAVGAVDDGPRVRQVSGTVHNLSVEGPGTTRASDLDEVCRFCHVAHGGSDLGLLFNKQESQAAYVPYSSPSLHVTPDVPQSVSRLCMSCHDGTVALGDLLADNTLYTFPTGRETLQPGFGGLEPMLQDDHPISFPYQEAILNGNTELRDQLSLPVELQLDTGGQVGCGTCHDAHDNTQGFFLRRPLAQATICTDCHVKTGWLSSAHVDAVRPTGWQKAVRTSGTTPLAKAVGDLQACNACHAVHYAVGQPLMAGPSEEAGCYGCHDSGGTATNVFDDFQQVSHHPIEATAGVHFSGENEQTMQRHVECADCHNPHAASNIGGAMGAMAEVPGITQSGLPVSPATDVQQVCYRCHGIDPPANPEANRQVIGYSIREEFDPALSYSSHPVERDSAGRSPSLLPGWVNVTRIGCLDCHGEPNTGKPHGSPYPGLRQDRYLVGGTGRGSFPNDMALCGKCHDLNYLRSGNGVFRKHDEHLKKNFYCSDCHDPHGVPGDAINHGGLINFNLDIVQPYKGIVEMEFQPGDKPRCTLSCHGKNHDRKG